MATFIIVDTMAMFHRVRHATRGDNEVKTGLALHILFNIIKAAWQKFDGDHLVFACDKKSWRYSVYPKYKAHRKLKQAIRSAQEKADDEYFFSVMNDFLDFVESRTNATLLVENGVEADDWIARWTQLHPDDHHVILSGDSDFFQLISPNVWLYDGIKEWTYRHDSVLDDDGNDAATKRNEMRKNPFTGKKERVSVTHPVPIPDPEWELFLKCMRGDAGDGIFSAYPRIRENKLMDAYDDRKTRGFAWNNVMQQTWVNHDGETVKVADAYEFNKSLIDLTRQPEEVKQLMDEGIINAVQKAPVSDIGLRFLQFCDKYNLVNVASRPTDYAKFLAASYRKV